MISSLFYRSGSLRKTPALAILVLLCCGTLMLRAETEVYDKQATQEALKDWQDKRFGMFIHWGPVAIKGTEIGWSRGKEVPNEEYDQLYRQFDPTKFNADEWVKTARDAGMKYLVITSKHHDGFCLWPSEYTDYHIGNTPFKRDVLKELKAACDKYGIEFCTYFSILDWRDPDYPLGSPGGSTKKENPNMERFFELDVKQTKELISKYGPLGLMWFDGDWEEPWNHEYGKRLYLALKEAQPSLIINNRVGKSRPGVASEDSERLPFSGDYDTPEQRVGSFDRSFPWETCMTICEQWSYKPDDKMKSLKQCLQALLQTVGGDGNFLFNVGPMPDGRIEPRQVERLEEMGQWLKKYGDGVYGTRGGPFKPGMWGASTCKDNKIYLFIMKWPLDGPLQLPAIPAKIVSSQTLSGGQADIQQNDTGILIDLPVEDRDEIAAVIELELDQNALQLEPIDVVYRSGSLARDKSTKASNVFHNEDEFSAKKATDDDNTTRWATDRAVTPVWLEVDLETPTTIEKVYIDEPSEYQRIEEFELQTYDGTDWKTFHSGTTIGPEWSTTVDPIVADRVRLNILKASDGPTIKEFQLYAPASQEVATDSK